VGLTETQIEPEYAKGRPATGRKDPPKAHRNIIRLWGVLNTNRPPVRRAGQRRWCGTGWTRGRRWRRCWRWPPAIFGSGNTPGRRTRRAPPDLSRCSSSGSDMAASGGFRTLAWARSGDKVADTRPSRLPPQNGQARPSGDPSVGYQAILSIRS
jgi:hypothetical protein